MENSHGDLYQDLLDAGVPLDSHYSDLYAKATPEARAVLARHRGEGKGTRGISTFRSNIDGAIWYDIPFAYRPYWEMVARKAERVGR